MKVDVVVVVVLPGLMAMCVGEVKCCVVGVEGDAWWAGGGGGWQNDEEADDGRRRLP